MRNTFMYFNEILVASKESEVAHKMSMYSFVNQTRIVIKKKITSDTCSIEEWLKYCINGNKKFRIYLK